MIETQSLNGEWKVTWTDGVHGLRQFKDFYQYPFENDPKRYLNVKVPQDLNDAFTEKGYIDDVNVKTNALKARWVGEQHYQYVTKFKVSANKIGKVSFLNFKRLDLIATIYLNGTEIGNHENAFTPCRIDVTDLLQEGENTLVVGIESGIYSVADKEISKYQIFMAGTLSKSVWLRKPQYQFGWDWNPILINVGITGDVFLEYMNHNKIDQMLVDQRFEEGLDKVALSINSFFRSAVTDKNTKLSIRIRETGDTYLFSIPEGQSRVTAHIEINNPQLWWSIGQGEQHLYHLDITYLLSDEVVDTYESRVGIRKIEIKREKDHLGESFIIMLNDRPVFCKGANWVPPELVYSKVDKPQIERLLDIALKANFNFLRIWGGGDYVGTDFLNLCDEHGILVWHDFLFACFRFPGDDQEFLDNIREEITWAVRAYSSHPSMIVWCGNNEVEMSCESEYGVKDYKKESPDYNIFHELIPSILKEEGITIPYWPTSPYSPDGSSHANPLVGDQHAWNFPLGDEPVNFWEYRTYQDRFPNEGGILGASTMSTWQTIFGEQPVEKRSFVWESHDNTVNYWDNELGQTYRQVEYWLGTDANELSVEDYNFSSAVIQAEGLMEYNNNFRRRMFDTSSAVFWMFNDSWPAIHGWTIIDYYLNEKLSFHPVKRSFSPVHVVIAEEKGKLAVFGMNEHLDDLMLNLEVGLIDLESNDKQVLFNNNVTLEKNNSTLLHAIDKLGEVSENSHKLIPYAMLKDHAGKILSQNRLFLAPFKEIAFGRPEVNIEQVNDEVLITSKNFVWGLSFEQHAETLPENYIDLIPGETYHIPWDSSYGTCKVLRTASELITNK